MVIGSTVLIDPVDRPKRLAVLGLRSGAHVSVLEGSEVVIKVSMWFETKPSRRNWPMWNQHETRNVSEEAVRIALQDLVPYHEMSFDGKSDKGHCSIELKSCDPVQVLTVLSKHALSIGCRMSVRLSEVDELGWAVRRVLATVAG